MNNITPITPSFVFGYWRPWKENANLLNSYLDYAKDISLAKYCADTVGIYTNQASKEQIDAINQLGQSIGRGLNVLSTQLSDINQSLGFLNRNLDIQIEQQKLSNLLLQDIAELLRVPDTEKERQNSIELGIKFFVNARKDSDLYADALEELLKAESIMKQDYFVLHLIGCIYLYAVKHINPEKALDYFVRAAKYASVESDPSAMRLYNALNGDYVEPMNSKSGFEVVLVSAGFAKLQMIKIIKELTGFSLKESKDIVDAAPRAIKVKLSKPEAEEFAAKLTEDLKTEDDVQISITNGGKAINEEPIPDTEELVTAKIEQLAADSYEKAAFSAYILGQFNDAVNYQVKSVQFNATAENRFLLAKYQVRNNQANQAVENLNQSIDQNADLIIAVFKEIDLVNEPKILNLIKSKNDAIDNKIHQLIEKWKSLESIKATTVINELSDLLNKSYEIKIANFQTYENEGNLINTNIVEFEAKIDALINEMSNTLYANIDINRLSVISKELEHAKTLPFEKMQVVYEGFKKELEDDKLQIGLKYAGGIIFHIDNTGRHGLVCVDIDLGEALWGSDEEIFALGCGVADGSGMDNTRKIVERGSWHYETGWFTTKKLPVLTAARLCFELNYNGFSDWYLPTIAELDLIFINRSKISSGIDRSGFEYSEYWSSTEGESNWTDRGWRKSFTNGDKNYMYKYINAGVRAIRAF